MKGYTASAVQSAAYEAAASSVTAGDRLLVVGRFAAFVSAADVLAATGGRMVTVTSATVKSSGLVELVAGTELFLVYSDDTVVVERG